MWISPLLKGDFFNAYGLVLVLSLFGISVFHVFSLDNKIENDYKILIRYCYNYILVFCSPSGCFGGPIGIRGWALEGQAMTSDFRA